MIETIAKKTPVILLYGILFLLSAVLFNMDANSTTDKEQQYAGKKVESTSLAKKTD